MSNIFTSSIGKKLVMSITGAFLVLFLAFHMCMNFVLVVDPSGEAYNAVCEFLGANWYALVGTAVLAAGVVIHFVYASFLTVQNLKARGEVRYAVTAKENDVEWSSKNMFVLGIIVILGLVLHLTDFWYNMQFAEIAGQESVSAFGQTFTPTDGAGIVTAVFGQPIFAALYLVWLFALWFHLTHGVWSMMHTAGWNSKVWMARLKCIANILSTIIVGGFALVVVVIFIRSNFC